MPISPRRKLGLALALLALVSVACTIFAPRATPTPAFTPTPEITPTPLPPIAPRVIDYSPLRGDELPVDGRIAVYFDTPMDRTSVQSAFSIQPAVAGTFNWVDDRTLEFAPASALERAQRYVVTLAAEAHSQAGLALPGPISFNADTVGFLEVTQVLPAPDTFGVEVEAVITIMFNRPVVPLTALAEQAGLPQPLSLAPAVTGKGEWLNTSIYVFRPDQPLAGGVTYTARVAGGLQDTTGGLLAEDYVWQFSTLPPDVIESTPVEGAYALPLTQPITLTFNQPMDHAATQAAFGLFTPAGEKVNGSFTWSEDSRSLGFRPAGRLALGTSYLAALDTSARSASGAGLARSFAVNFTTALPPALLSTDPTDGALNVPLYNGFRLFFASPMDVASLDANLDLQPAPTQVYTYWNDYELSYYVGWDLAPSTEYVVTIGASMRDPYGNQIPEGRTVRFTTAALDPQAYFNTNGLVGTYNAGAETELYVTTINQESLEFGLYRLPLRTFARLTGPNSYEAFQAYRPAAEDVVREWTQAVPSDLNETILNRVPLVDGGGALPPGSYLLRLRARNIGEAYHLLVVSGAHLVLKHSFDQALVWATDLNTGQPLADLPIQLYDLNFDRLVEGRTDPDGLFQASLPGRNNLWDQLYALSQGGSLPSGQDAFAVTISDWSSGVDAWDFGLGSQYYKQDLVAYLYTDRPVYRPGQVVYFKGLLRADDDARYQLPTQKQVEVTINDDQGEQVYQAELPLSDFGSFSGEFQLAQEAGLGYYYMNVAVAETDVANSSLSFSVAEYRKPEFQVSVTSPVSQVVQGETIPVTLDASFFFGGPVSNAEVRWSVLAADYVFNWTGSGYYDFYDFDYSSGEPWPQYGAYGRQVLDQAGRTDAQGRATLAVRADLSDKGLSQLYTLEATVTDINGQQVSGRVEVVVHQGRFYIGVRPERYVGEAGKPAAVEIRSVDWNSDAFPNQPLRVVFNDHQWNCALERDPESGGDTWACHVKDTPVAEVEVTTDADGRASASFTPPKGGTYQIKVSGLDREGHSVTASTIMWVADPGGYVSWRQDNNDRISLVADRKTYRPGDTAEILIPSPFQGEALALISLERGSILEHRVVRLTDNSTLYRLPITADYAPDVFFSVIIVKGVDENNPTPAFKMGLVKLSVSPEQQQLLVTLTPDKVKVGPRDSVTYQIRATDYTGKPVQAEFSVGVSDLAALSLAAPNSGPILDAFYGERGLGVRTGLGLTLAVDRLNLQAARAKGGGGGAEAGFDQVRSQFLDTAFWRAVLSTDANGEASVTVALPDNLTTWRLDARGLTADTRVGQARVDIVATRDLLIRPLTPRFFIAGDRARLSAVVNNNTAQDLEVSVSLAGTGVDLISPAAQSVSVSAGGRAEVTWDVTVQDVPAVDLTFTAEGGGLRDASKPTLGLPPDQRLPVYKYSAPETVGTAGQLDSANSVLEAISLPRRYDVTQGDLTVELEPSLAAAMTGGLEYLKHFPYECTEQTVSRFLPNVLTYRALKDLGLTDPALETELQTQVGIGLQRLYSRQHVDGGWGWWANDASDPYISAYVVFGLVKASQSGFEVSQGVINSGLAYLREQLLPPGEVEQGWVLNRQAFILYTLAEAGAGRVSDTVQLYERRARLDTYARAYLALTFHLVDPADDTRVKALLSDINNAAILSATGAHWEETGRDWWNMNTDTRSTAIVLDTLALLDPENALIPNVVRWLMTARRASAWETTQETAWSLIALTDWMVASGELKANYSYGVTLNGQELAAGTVGPDNLRDPVSLKVAVADLLKDQANRLVIGRGEGDGRLYYTAHLNVYLPVPEVPALNRGIIVARQYSIVSPECGGAKQPACPPVSAAQAGQDIRVKVTLIAPNDLYYVVLEDPIPAGTEPVDTSLQTTSITGQAPELNPADPFYYGWGWWWFSNTDLRDEKVVLFATVLPKGTYEYTYVLHASLPGAYQVIPTTAREFYFPEVFGRGEGTLFTIQP